MTATKNGTKQRQIYREYLKVEFLRKYYGFEIFQIAFSGRHLSLFPPLSSLFPFFLFLLFTIRCIRNFPPLKFKIDRLMIPPVKFHEYFRVVVNFLTREIRRILVKNRG